MAVLKRKALKKFSICPGPLFERHTTCRNAKKINHYFFYLKMSKFFAEASPPHVYDVE